MAAATPHAALLSLHSPIHCMPAQILSSYGTKSAQEHPLHYIHRASGTQEINRTTTTCIRDLAIKWKRICKGPLTAAATTSTCYPAPRHSSSHFFSSVQAGKTVHPSHYTPHSFTVQCAIMPGLCFSQPNARSKQNTHRQPRQFRACVEQRRFEFSMDGVQVLLTFTFHGPVMHSIWHENWTRKHRPVGCADLQMLPQDCIQAHQTVEADHIMT
jgi:hypothetical protein